MANPQIVRQITLKWTPEGIAVYFPTQIPISRQVETLPETPKNGKHPIDYKGFNVGHYEMENNGTKQYIVFTTAQGIPADHRSITWCLDKICEMGYGAEVSSRGELRVSMAKGDTWGEVLKLVAWALSKLED